MGQRLKKPHQHANPQIFHPAARGYEVVTDTAHDSTHQHRADAEKVMLHFAKCYDWTWDVNNANLGWVLRSLLNNNINAALKHVKDLIENKLINAYLMLPVDLIAATLQLSFPPSYKSQSWRNGGGKPWNLNASENVTAYSEKEGVHLSL